MRGSKIEYLTSFEIDAQKWDDCIDRSANGLIYAKKLYLDLMADHWNAIVINDYEAVMPLPWRKKLLQHYYYHVPFIPQCGIFGNVDSSLFSEIIKLAFRKIRSGEIFLNHGNKEIAKFLSAKKLLNTVLDLSPQYDTIADHYHADLVKHLKKASRYKHKYAPDNRIRNAITLFVKHYGSEITSLGGADYERFSSVCIHLYHSGQAIIRKINDGKGKLLAIALLLKDDRRIYSMMNTVLPDGRSRAANHLLFDNIIREFAGSGLKLDFEGSDISGIRRFYRNFGAADEYYYLYSRFTIAGRVLKRIV